MRLAQLLAWGGLIVAIALALFRRDSPARGRHATPDVLVKDPVCQTYIVRSRAIVRAGAHEPQYFCSVECARRYAAGTRV